MKSITDPDDIVKPGEISAKETEGARQLTVHSFIIGMVMVVTLNSGSIVELARSLPFGPVRVTGEALAQTWHDRMETYGLSDFHREVERRVQAFRERQWPSRPAPEPRRDSPAAQLSERIEHREI